MRTFAQYCAAKGKNKDEFEELINSLLDYRNKILGHLDGDAFEVEHADPDPSSNNTLEKTAYRTTTSPKLATFDDDKFVQLENLAEIGVLFSHEYKKLGLSILET